jgi:RimJ/RimL family protein N-acetyltransferase
VTNVSLVCTHESFAPVATDGVRWLDVEADFALADELWRTNKLDLVPREWEEWHRDGYRYCSCIDDGRLVSIAARWAYADDAWELAAVHTLSDYRGRGYASAACSFATAAIVTPGRRATCHTEAGNAPMLRVAEKLGYRSVP